MKSTKRKICEVENTNNKVSIDEKSTDQESTIGESTDKEDKNWTDDETTDDESTSEEPTDEESFDEFMQGNHEKRLEIISRPDFDPNRPVGKYKRTPLYYAIRQNQQCVVKRLIESKADVNKKCQKPRTYPLVESFTDVAPDIQRLLLDARASVECTNWHESNILHVARGNDPTDENDPIHSILSSAYHLLFRMTNTGYSPYGAMLKYNKPMSELYRRVMTMHLFPHIETHVPIRALVNIVISLYFSSE